MPVAWWPTAAAQVGQRLSAAVESRMDAFLAEPLACIEQVRKALARQASDASHDRRSRSLRELADPMLQTAELRVSEGAHYEAKMLRSLLLRRYGLVSCPCLAPVACCLV